MSANPAIPLPRLNQRLEVAIGERGGSAEYFSRLVEETADTLRISAPEFEGSVVDLREGSGLRLWYTQNGGYWCLHTTVRTIYERDGETILELKRGGDVHRAQRRNHVRVDVSLMLHAFVDNDGELERVTAVTRNISGGGINFRSSSELTVGDRMQVKFYLPEHDGEISSRARIVQSHPDPEREGQFIIACTFERMAITDRERIIRYLFFRQRELAGRKKVMR